MIMTLMFNTGLLQSCVITVLIFVVYAELAIWISALIIKQPPSPTLLESSGVYLPSTQMRVEFCLNGISLPLIQSLVQLPVVLTGILPLTSVGAA